jgi:hypothetical protein
MSSEQVWIMVLGALLSIISTLAVFIFKLVWGRIATLEAGGRDLERRIDRDYHTKSDLSQILDEKLRPLEDKLDEVLSWIHRQNGGQPLSRHHT